MLDGERLGPAHGPVGALGARSEDDLGPEELQRLPALDGDVVGQQDLDRVALEAGDRGEGDPRVARRRLDDRLTRTQPAVPLGVVDHLFGDAILHRTERVLALQLGEDPHVRVGRQLQTSTRGVLPINSSTLWFTRLTVSIDAGSLSDNPDGLHRPSTRSAPGRAIGHVDRDRLLGHGLVGDAEAAQRRSSCCRLTMA